MTDQAKQNYQAVLGKMQAARKAVLEEIGKRCSRAGTASSRGRWPRPRRSWWIRWRG